MFGKELVKSSNRSECSSFNRDDVNALCEGFPFALAVNILIAVIFILIYLVLSCKAAKRTDSSPFTRNAIQFIYGQRSKEALHPFKRLGQRHPNEYDHWVSNWFFVPKSHWSRREKQRMDKHGEALEKLRDVRLAFWKIRLKDVLDHCGRDAYHFLKFQQRYFYVLLYLGFIVAGITIPMNIFYNSGNKYSHYYELTLLSQFSFSWVHAFIAIFITLVVSTVNLVLILEKTEDYPNNKNVVLVRRFTCFDRDCFESCFRKKFPRFPIRDVIFTHNFTEMQQDFEDIKGFRLMLKEIKKYNDANPEKPLKIRETEDAFTFYTEKLKAKQAEVFPEKMKQVKENTVPLVFLRFQSPMSAERFLKLHKKLAQAIQRKDSGTEEFRIFFKQLDQLNWLVDPAPNPRNIDWTSLTTDQNKLKLQQTISFTLIFVVFVFLSTPAIALSYANNFLVLIHDSALDTFNIRMNVINEISTLLLILFTFALPRVVNYLAKSRPTTFQSEEAINQLKYQYLFIVIMVLILPSIGSSSIYIFVLYLYEDVGQFYNLACFLTKESGHWFIGFILRVAALNFFNLTRLYELYLYMAKCKAHVKNDIEYPIVRNHTRFDFCYPTNTAFCLLIITISFTYALVCPVILLCGAVYIFTSHMCSRINIYKFYEADGVHSHEFQMLVAKFCHVGCLLMLLQIFFHEVQVEPSIFTPTHTIGVWFLIYTVYVIRFENDLVVYILSTYGYSVNEGFYIFTKLDQSLSKTDTMSKNQDSSIAKTIVATKTDTE